MMIRMSAKKIDSAIITVCALRAYALSFLINIVGFTILVYATNPGSDAGESGYGYAAGIIILAILFLFVLGPLNALLVMLMYFLNINKHFLLNYKYTITEICIFYGSYIGWDYLFLDGSIWGLFTSWILSSITAIISGFIISRTRKFRKLRKNKKGR